MPTEFRETRQSAGKSAKPKSSVISNKRTFKVYTHIIIRQDYAADDISHLCLKKDHVAENFLCQFKWKWLPLK